MRYRLDVVAPTVSDAVRSAGGWIYDRVMAGWDVTVLVGGGDDLRPLQILGADALNLGSVLADWADRPHPQTVAVAAELFDRDPRVLAHVRNALDAGTTEVTLWGENLTDELYIRSINNNGGRYNPGATRSALVSLAFNF